MKYLIIIFFINTLNCFSQDLERVKQQDVVIILFDGNEQTQSKYSCDKNQRSMDKCWYDFIFLEENIYSLQKEVITLVYNEYKDFDEMERDNQVPYFKVNKRI